jgi:hypothetical protein
MTNLLLVAILALLVLGGLYWTISVELREQFSGDRILEAWLRAHRGRLKSEKPRQRRFAGPRQRPRDLRRFKSAAAGSPKRRFSGPAGSRPR